MTELKKCQDCTYWIDIVYWYPDMGEDDRGTCVRFPAEVVKRKDDWCGEWTEENVRERYNDD
jgi:hypothetical protein